MTFKKLSLLAFLFQIPSTSLGQVCLYGDCINGNGAYEYRNGTIYIGQFVNKLRSGKGVMRTLGNPDKDKEICSQPYIECGSRSVFIKDRRLGQSALKRNHVYVEYEAEFIKDEHICHEPAKPILPNNSDSKEAFERDFNNSKRWIKNTIDYLNCSDTLLLTIKSDISSSSIHNVAERYNISKAEYNGKSLQKNDKVVQVNAYLRSSTMLKNIIDDMYVKRYNEVYDDREGYVNLLNQQVKKYKVRQEQRNSDLEIGVEAQDTIKQFVDKNLSTVEQELKKIEALFDKSLISSIERQQLRNKALGLN